MKRRVYRSLDSSVSFFGVKGRFLWVMALGGAFALIAGMVVSRLSVTLVGFGAGLIVVVGAYLLTQVLQSKIDENRLLKILVKRGYPSLYRVPPKHIRNIWKGFNLPAAD